MATDDGAAPRCKHGYLVQGDVLARQCHDGEDEALCAERPAKRERGKLIEPIYLCVGMALAVTSMFFVLLPFGRDLFNVIALGVACELLLLALVLLFVELRRG